MTFVFYETSCSTAVSFVSAGTCLSQPVDPVPIASLTVSELAGSASYSQTFGPSSLSISDPTFSFSSGGIGGIFIQAPDFAVGLARYYNITWTMDGDQLTSLSARGSEWNTTITSFGLTGGIIGSDASIGTCQGGACALTGFWLDPVAVAEPGADLVFATLLGLLVLIRLGFRSGRLDQSPPSPLLPLPS